LKSSFEPYYINLDEHCTTYSTHAIYRKWPFKCGKWLYNVLSKMHKIIGTEFSHVFETPGLDTGIHTYLYFRRLKMCQMKEYSWTMIADLVKFFRKLIADGHVATVVESRLFNGVLLKIVN
jgi:hypothetical protein